MKAKLLNERQKRMILQHELPDKVLGERFGISATYIAQVLKCASGSKTPATICGLAGPILKRASCATLPALLWRMKMNVLENLLVTLMEECSEVAKAASKILRAGPDSTINGTRSTTNLQELQAELDDLQGVLLELRANGLDVVVRSPAAVVKKREKLRYFIGVSRQLGFVQGPLAAGEPEASTFSSNGVTTVVVGEALPGCAPFAHLTIDEPRRFTATDVEVHFDGKRIEGVLDKPFVTLDPSLLSSAKDFAEQYQCTPVPTVKKVIDTLLNETNYSRDYLQELALADLLDTLRAYPQHRDLYRELRSHIDHLNSQLPRPAV